MRIDSGDLADHGDVLLDGGGVEHRAVTLGVAATLEGQSSMVPAVEHAILLARAAQAREEAARHQRAGDAVRAQALMQGMSDSLASSPLAADAEFSHDLLSQASDLRALGMRYGEGEFGEMEAKYQMQRSHNARRGKRQYDQRLSRPSHVDPAAAPDPDAVP